MLNKCVNKHTVKQVFHECVYVYTQAVIDKRLLLTQAALMKIRFRRT